MYETIVKCIYIYLVYIRYCVSICQKGLVTVVYIYIRYCVSICQKGLVTVVYRRKKSVLRFTSCSLIVW